MSVLIKGMEMPKTCSDCLLSYECTFCSLNAEIYFHGTGDDYFNKRDDRCPLVEMDEVKE